MSWSTVSSERITVRKLWNPSDWDVVYELGPFHMKSGVVKFCANRLDSDWFVETVDYDTDLVNTPVHQFGLHTMYLHMK